MRTFFLAVACSPCLLLAQDNWVDAGMPYQTVGVRQLCNDEEEDVLIAVGFITNSNDYSHPVAAVYDGSQWEPIDVFEWGGLNSVTRFGDTLVFAGHFQAVNGTSVGGAAAYANGAWLPFGDFDAEVRKLKVLNGVLYAVGAFEYADGHLCNGIAKRVGGEWVNVGNLQQDVPGAPILVEVAEYAGELYVGGSLSLADGTNGIAKFDGTSWTGPGGGILGGATAVLAMEVYGGSLYAGGEIDINSGNVGHGIMRWDGNQWHAVGGSVQDIYCGSSYPARVYELLEHDGLLLVGGGFGCAGGIPASRFAVWDGYQWCANASVMTGYVESMAFYHDTLFIACGHVVEGDSVNRVAKWVGGAYGDSCQVVAVNEPGPWPDQLRVRLSVPGTLTISGLPPGGTAYSLCDAMGRLLHTGSLAANGQNAVEVRLPALASGAYVFVVDGLGYRFIVAGP